MPLQVTPPGELQIRGSRGSLGLLPKGKALLPFNQHQRRQEDEDEDEDEDDNRSDTSSIGACSSDDDNRSDEDEDDEEVQSKLNDHHVISLGHRQPLEDDDGGDGKILSSLDSLEDSLPFKRGLSNFYSGKSKSFTSLSTAAAVASAKDIVKPENPLNKRRRLFIARSRNRRASCSSLVSIAEADPDDSPFLPLLPPVLSEDEGDDEDDDDDDDAQESLEQASPSSSHSSDHHQHHHQQQQQLMMRRSRTEKRRPSLFTVSITPLEARSDQDSFLTPKLVRSRSGNGSGGFARSLSLSDLSRHGHPHLPASTHAPP